MKLFTPNVNRHPWYILTARYHTKQRDVTEWGQVDTVPYSILLLIRPWDCRLVLAVKPFKSFPVLSIFNTVFKCQALKHTNDSSSVTLCRKSDTQSRWNDIFVCECIALMEKMWSQLLKLTSKDIFLNSVVKFENDIDAKMNKLY